jgi:hypothetical protein
VLQGFEMFVISVFKSWSENGKNRRSLKMKQRKGIHTSHLYRSSDYEREK